MGPGMGMSPPAEAAEPAPVEASAEKSEQAPAEDEPLLDPKELEQFTQMLGGLMGGMEKLSFTQRVTVPGKVLSVTPDTAEVVKSTVSWTLGMEQLMAMGANPQSMSVTFKPKGKAAKALLQR